MDLLFDDREKLIGPDQDRLEKLEELIGWPLEIKTGIAKCYVKVSLNSYIHNRKIGDRTDIYIDGPEAGPIICGKMKTLIDEILKIAESNPNSIKKLLDEESSRTFSQ